MFISMNWISEFVDLTGLDRNKLISQFSLSTAEVENEIFYKGSNISDIVVAQIIEVNEHPESSKLHLLKVDDGSGNLVDVVCGAPNVREGMIRFDDSIEFITLDKVERTIDSQTLMICNDNEPVAIAGIMGGLESEILDDTRELTLESAAFETSGIRKASVRLAHRTDASARYEKSLAPELCPIAIGRFLYLLSKIDKGFNVISSLTDEWRFRYPEVKLEFDKDYVDKYTGVNISSDTIEHTLKSLGFGVERIGNSFKVVVPSWRATKDVTIKADIIEEITRIYGYDNFDVFTVEFE